LKLIYTAISQVFRKAVHKYLQALIVKRVTPRQTVLLFGVVWNNKGAPSIKNKYIMWNTNSQLLMDSADRKKLFRATSWLQTQRSRVRFLTRFSEWQWVWNGVHLVLVRTNEELLERKVAAPV
jgi:hypothetical protein